MGRASTSASSAPATLRKPGCGVSGGWAATTHTTTRRGTSGAEAAARGAKKKEKWKARFEWAMSL